MSNQSKENNKNITNIQIDQQKHSISHFKTPTKGYYPPSNSTKGNYGFGNTTYPQKGLKYRTELCKNFELTGTCKYGNKCDYAHGLQDLRKTNQSNHSFKIKKCKSFFTNGYCPYGIRCQFSHSLFPNISYEDLFFLLSLFGKEAKKERLSVFQEICKL